MKRYGLDKHTAPAYLTALKGIKDMKRYNLRVITPFILRVILGTSP